jgi:RND family efflux transporter MFP subunit
LEAELVSAQANRDSAQKNLRSIQELLSHLVIRSPKSGIVATKYFEQGEYLGENEKLLTIMDVNQVHAVFSIQEQDIGHFQLGSPVEVEVPALGIKSTVPVAEISPMADPESGNFTVKSYLANESHTIKPGMFVKCLLPRDSALYPAIPESALITEWGSKSEAEWTGSVFLVHDNRAIKQEVAVLDKADGRVWISHGLTEGQWVVNNPSPFLKEGQNIE